MILRTFLFLEDFDPDDYYKEDSYKKNGVIYPLTFSVNNNKRD